MDASKLKFKVCGMGPKPFFILFAVVLIAVYGNFMPLAKIYSNASGNFVVSSYVLTVAFLMAMGGLFFWLGNTIPIVNNYLGGACLLPLIGASWLNYVGLIPKPLENGIRTVMRGGFQDMYIAALLIGSVLVMDRKILLKATARYLPAIIGSQVVALVSCYIGGKLIGFGAAEGLFYIGAPCMSGGSAGAMTTLPLLYSELSGKDMTSLAGQFLCYASIANVLAVVLAALGGGITSKISGLNGNGNILIGQEHMITENNHKSARILHGCGLFVSCGKILANGFKLQGTVLFLSKNGLIHGLIPVWMLTIHLLVFCFVKLRENLFLNLPKSRVPTPIF